MPCWQAGRCSAQGPPRAHPSWQPWRPSPNPPSLPSTPHTTDPCAGTPLPHPLLSPLPTPAPSAQADHGYALVARFYPAAAPALDATFRTAFSLTYNRLSAAAGERVDTEPFRTAVRMYVQRLFGVRNDHYDYRLVNRFMTIAAKTFVKKVVCAPETVSREDFERFSELFSVDEKVHVVLIAAEARHQAALLWGLAAVMRAMEG